MIFQTILKCIQDLQILPILYIIKYNTFNFVF